MWVWLPVPTPVAPAAVLIYVRVAAGSSPRSTERTSGFVRLFVSAMRGARPANAKHVAGRDARTARWQDSRTGCVNPIIVVGWRVQTWTGRFDVRSRGRHASTRVARRPCTPVAGAACTTTVRVGAKRWTDLDTVPRPVRGRPVGMHAAWKVARESIGQTGCAACTTTGSGRQARLGLPVSCVSRAS